MSYTRNPWEVSFVLFVEHLKQNNGAYPQTSTNQTLARWVVNNREKKGSGKLQMEQLKKLEEIGFIWDPQEKAWELKFKEWKKWHDAGEVEKRPKELSCWVKRQRASQRHWESGKTTLGTIRKGNDFEPSGKRKDLLEKAGFIFDHLASKKTKIDCVEVQPNRLVVQEGEDVSPSLSKAMQNISLLPEEYCAKESHLVCLKELGDEYGKMDDDERKRSVAHCQVLEKEYDDFMKYVEDSRESPKYREWKRENTKIKEQGKNHRQRSEDYWTGKKKPSMLQEQDWPPGFVFDPASRILMVDFKIVVQKSFLQLFWKCLERDDIAVVTEGLELTEELWTLESIIKAVPEEHEHGSVQKFCKENGSVVVTETSIPMTCGEFKRRVTRGDKLYMSDFPVNLIPKSKKEFEKVMELMMPGGPNCLMRDVSENRGCPLVTIRRVPSIWYCFSLYKSSSQ